MSFGIPDWAVGVGFILLVAYLGKALIRAIFPGERWAGRRGTRDIAQSMADLPRRLAELDDVGQRLGQIDDLQRRLAEVEERLDFAERLLTKERDAERLASPPQ